MGSTWLHRNFDIAAVALIAIFGIAGAVVYKPYRMPVIFPSAPMVREVKPRLLEIHSEYRNAAREMQQELCENSRTLHGDLDRTKEEVRRDSHRAASELREELRNAARSLRGELYWLRDWLHSVRDTMRENVRNQRPVY
jgi:hypothetical protein